MIHITNISYFQNTNNPFFKNDPACQYVGWFWNRHFPWRWLSQRPSQHPKLVSPSSLEPLQLEPGSFKHQRSWVTKKQMPGISKSELWDNSDILTTSDCRIAPNCRPGNSLWPFFGCWSVTLLKAVEVKWPPTKGLKGHGWNRIGALSWKICFRYVNMCSSDMFWLCMQNTSRILVVWLNKNTTPLSTINLRKQIYEK